MHLSAAKWGYEFSVNWGYEFGTKMGLQMYCP